MAKIYGLNGVITGKQGGTVFAVRAGENIARKYQPVVANPSTEAQVAVRARLKLLSQLSAVMAPVIAIPKQGAVSSRNIFTKINYPQSTYNNGVADITIASVVITSSVVGLPSIVVTRGEGTTATIALQNRIEGLSRVVYALFIKQPDSKLRLVSSYVVTDAGENQVYSQQVSLFAASNYVVLGYGVRDNTDAARTVFGNLTAPTAEQVAKLIVSRTLTENDVTLTETRGVEVPVA